MKGTVWFGTLAALAITGLGRGALPQASGPGRALVADTVSSVAAIVEREYFDAETGARVATVVRQKLANGGYDGVASRAALAALLTADLRAATSDLHLLVAEVAGPAPGTPATSPPDDRRERGRRENFGVERAEILPGNVGLLALTSFYRLDEARDAIDAALGFVRHADALLLDLRGNGGGAPDTVAYLAGHFVTPATQPLFEIVARDGAVQRYDAPAASPADRDTSRPLFVLTARGTFSAGEGLACLLQAVHRAEVVGERTAGAANPGRPYPVNDQFEVVVPNGRVRVAGTDRNWEGTGVVPDVAVSADDALRIAQLRALERLVETARPGPWRETLRRRIDDLEGAAR